MIGLSTQQESPESTPQRPTPSAALTKAKGLYTQLCDLIHDLEAIDRMAHERSQHGDRSKTGDRVDAHSALILRKIQEAGDAASRLTGDTHALARELSYCHGRVTQVLEYHAQDEAGEAGR